MAKQRCGLMWGLVLCCTMGCSGEDLPVGDSDDEGQYETFIAGGNGANGGSNSPNNGGGNGVTNGSSGGVTNGSSGGASNLPDLQDASYANDVEPVLRSFCASCHLDGNRQGGFAFEGGVGDLVGVASSDVPSMDLVTPFEPQASYLLHKLEGTHLSVSGQGGPMPPSGQGLSSLQLEQVRQWIVDGALP